MNGPIHRHALLAIAAAAALAAIVGPVRAQPTPITGAVQFEGGAVIPEGQLEIYLEDPAFQDQAERRVAHTQARSDGGAKAIEFSLSPPASPTSSDTLQVVVRLERADGWLVARGSSPVAAGSPVSVTLYPVMY